MSLVSHFVLADDGKWYEEAIIGEIDKWYICFDDDDPPELVIRMIKTGHRKITDKDEWQSPFSVGEAASPADIIKSNNLPFAVTSGPQTAHRAFPNNKGQFRMHKMHNSHSYFLRQTGVIPARLIVAKSSVHDTRPQEPGVYYGDPNQRKKGRYARQGR